MNIENRITNYGTSASVNNLIIAHETANGNSTIDGEVNYMKNHWNSAFVTHFVGGGGRIIQTAPVGRVSWGAGAKANPYAYAQIELCRAKDKATFKKDYEAYIWLLRDLAGKAGIPKTLDTGSSVSNKGIKSHLWVTQNLGGTNHTDPYGYLSSMGISKAQFKKDVENGIGSGSSAPSTSKPSAKKTVKVGKQAKQWADGKNISSWVIGQTFEVQKEISITKSRSKKAYRLLNKGVVIGDLLEQDVEGFVSSGSTSTANGSTSTSTKPTVTGNSVIKGIQANVGVTQDGWDGPNSRRGVIKLFQRGIGAPDDGIIGPISLGKAPLIRSGSQGWHVYALQAMLYLKGYTSVGTPDKIAGGNTVKAIRNFQKDSGLPVDGIAGKQVYGKLFK